MKNYLAYSPKYDELTAAEEQLLDKDVQLIEEAVSVSHRLNKKRISTRNAHAKSFGFVRGHFIPVKNKEVDISEYFGGDNLGVIIRYSHPNFVVKNGNNEYPLYGSAIKIYNKNIAVSAKFPLVNFPVFVTNSVSKFLKLHIKANQYLISKSKVLPVSVFKLPGLLKAGLSLFADTQIFSILNNTLKILDLEKQFIATYDFHSIGCFRLDDRIVKIRVTPTKKKKEVKNTDLKQAESLRTYFLSRDLSLDFQIQLATHEKKTPVNNLLKTWQEKHSKFITVGQIILPKQDIRNYETMDYENLSFNPFENIEALQPVGRMQKIRQKIYNKSVETRQKLNKA